MGNVGATNTALTAPSTDRERDKDKKGNKDTLFGPSIGVVGTSPSWCSDFAADYGRDVNDEKSEGWEVDELTPDIVKEWERRSKDVRLPVILGYSLDTLSLTHIWCLSSPRSQRRPVKRA